MTWNTQNNIVTGTPLTTTLWNNDLGTNGSLKYVYDELNTTQLKHNIVLLKSSITNYTSAANLSLTFDTIITTYADQQLNFPVTVPVTNIPMPASGMYMATLQFLTTLNVVFRINYVVYDSISGTTYNYTDTNTTAGGNRFIAKCIFYVPNSSTTLTVFGQSSAATVLNYDTFTSPFGGSPLLTIVRM